MIDFALGIALGFGIGVVFALVVLPRVAPVLRRHPRALHLLGLNGR